MGENDIKFTRKDDYERLLEMDEKMAIYRVHINCVVEQDINPQVMPNNMLKQLTKNIANRKTLEQLPYGCITSRGVEIISGHHRIRAARMANISYVYMLIDESNLTKDQIISKQLSHNNIVGSPDDMVTKKLFDMIHDVEIKIEAFVNLDNLNINPDRISVPQIFTQPDFKIISLVFLPTQLEKFEELIVRLTGDEEEIYTSELKFYPKFKEALNEVRQDYKIRNLGCALGKMADICLEALKERENE